MVLIAAGFGIEEIGLFAVFQAKVFFLSALIKFGFSQSTYQLASQSSSKLSINLQIFQIWSIFWILLFSTILYVAKFLQFPLPTDVIFIFISALMISWVNIESALRLPDFSPIKALAIEDLIPGILFIILIVICLIFNFEVELINLYIISLIPSMLFVLNSRIKNFNYEKLDFLSEVIPTFKKNASFFMINISQVANAHGALLLLGYISSPAFSGSYRIGIAIMSIYSIIASSLATELQRIASREELSMILKKKNQFALINFSVITALTLVLCTTYSLLDVFNLLAIKTIVQITIILSCIMMIKAFFGFPDPILVANHEEYYVSRIFILNAMIFFAIAVTYIFIGGSSPLILISIIALIQPSSIIFYTKYLKKRYDINSYINLMALKNY